MKKSDINKPFVVEDELARLRDLKRRGQFSLFIKEQLNLGEFDDRVLSLPFPRVFRALPVFMGILVIPFLFDEFFHWPLFWLLKIEIASSVGLFVVISYMFIRNQIYLYRENKWQEYGMQKDISHLMKRKF